MQQIRAALSGGETSWNSLQSSAVSHRCKWFLARLRCFGRIYGDKMYSKPHTPMLSHLPYRKMHPSRVSWILHRWLRPFIYRSRLKLCLSCATSNCSPCTWARPRPLMMFGTMFGARRSSGLETTISISSEMPKPTPFSKVFGDLIASWGLRSSDGSFSTTG